MARPNLRVIAGRPIPVLTQEYRTESLSAMVQRWLYSLTGAVLMGAAILAGAYFAAVLILSIGGPR